MSKASTKNFADSSGSRTMMAMWRSLAMEVSSNFARRVRRERRKAAEMTGAVAGDARQEIDFPGEILRHCLARLGGALIGFEPGIDRLVRHVVLARLQG